MASISTNSSISMMISAIAAKMNMRQLNNRLILFPKGRVVIRRSHLNWICLKFKEYLSLSLNNCRSEVILNQATSTKFMSNYSTPYKTATYATRPVHPQIHFPSHPQPIPKQTLRLLSCAHISYSFPAIRIRLGLINGFISKFTIETTTSKSGRLLLWSTIARKLSIILRKLVFMCLANIEGEWKG